MPHQPLRGLACASDRARCTAAGPLKHEPIRKRAKHAGLRSRYVPAIDSTRLRKSTRSVADGIPTGTVGTRSKSKRSGSAIDDPPGLRDRATAVSSTMIVRNEEENLPKCLASVDGIFYEIVIIDTGSTDRTKKIAREFGAKVFDFPWIDDFAAARTRRLRMRPVILGSGSMRTMSLTLWSGRSWVLLASLGRPATRGTSSAPGATHPPPAPPPPSPGGAR